MENIKEIINRTTKGGQKAFNLKINENKRVFCKEVVIGEYHILDKWISCKFSIKLPKLNNNFNFFYDVEEEYNKIYSGCYNDVTSETYSETRREQKKVFRTSEEKKFLGKNKKTELSILSYKNEDRYNYNKLQPTYELIKNRENSVDLETILVCAAVVYTYAEKIIVEEERNRYLKGRSKKDLKKLSLEELEILNTELNSAIDKRLMKFKNELNRALNEGNNPEDWQKLLDEEFGKGKVKVEDLVEENINDIIMEKQTAEDLENEKSARLIAEIQEKERKAQERIEKKKQRKENLNQAKENFINFIKTSAPVRFAKDAKKWLKLKKEELVNSIKTKIKNKKTKEEILDDLSDEK